ncbi:hypothetical protein ACOMHN_040443 [Nucella lapillus]
MDEASTEGDEPFSESDEVRTEVDDSLSEVDEQFITVDEAMSEGDEEIVTADESSSEAHKYFTTIEEPLSEAEKHLAKTDKPLSETDEHFATIDEALSEAEEYFETVDEPLSGEEEQFITVDDAFSEADELLSEADENLPPTGASEDVPEAISSLADALRSKVGATDEVTEQEWNPEESNEAKATEGRHDKNGLSDAEPTSSQTELAATNPGTNPTPPSSTQHPSPTFTITPPKLTSTTEINTSETPTTAEHYPYHPQRPLMPMEDSSSSSDDDVHRRKTMSRDPKEDEEEGQQRGQGGGRGRENGERRRGGGRKMRRVKRLIERIPCGKFDVYRYPVDWTIVDQCLTDRRIKPWVRQKLKEYTGEESPTLTDFICRQVLSHSSPQSIYSGVVTVLDDEADLFMVKLWRLLIFETEGKKCGLVK